jgi:acyl-CoA reductase-like NAD-dependent aldehyde dehydrogenase
LPATRPIVKPPPSAPLATTRVVQRIAEKLPPGVLNVVTGTDANMAGLIQNTDVAKVCFTGSVGGGKRMMEMAAKTLTRVTLELGGNDAAVFLEDAIIDDVHLDRLYAAIYDTTGQICMNAKRVYVHRSRLDEVVDGLSARLDKAGHRLRARRGHTNGPPCTPSAQKAFVEEIIQEAKDAGADAPRVRRAARRRAGRRELLAAPAIVVNPDSSLRVVHQEQFGPVIPIIGFDTEEEAVALAIGHVGRPVRLRMTADHDAANRVGSQLV